MNIYVVYIFILFAKSLVLSHLCIMRLLLFVCTSLLLLGSCTSEYEERMEEAIVLKEKLALIEETHFISPSIELASEIEVINDRIGFLAKLSGNESLFMAQLLEE